MRPRTLVAIGFALTLAGAASAARAEDGYRHGRLRYVDPGVTMQRATDSGAEEAFANAPFLPGDRVWTDGSGRADFEFPDGSAVRLDSRGKLDYAGHDEDGVERIVLRLWSGSVMMRTRSREDARLELETPGGTVQGVPRSLVRVDVDAGEARVSVYEGEAVLDDGQDRVRLSAGERAYARWGGRAEQPEQFDVDEQDDFARWEADRESDERWAASSSPYLPEELQQYSGDFDRYGEWRYDTSIGYVWVPVVETDWRPYWNGHWAWTPYGWTWVPNERWGWAPFHYGRWGFSASIGWYWIPGRTWGPGWVSWAMGGGYVGWCPLGRHDRPVVAWGTRDSFDHGHAVPRGRAGRRQPDGWSIVRQGQLGRRDLASVRLDTAPIETAQLRVADSAQLRPTRDGAQLLASTAVPRAIRTRPTPGDFVRELAVDNKMTPSPGPWFRRGPVGEVAYDRGHSADRSSAGSAARREPTTGRAGEERGGVSTEPRAERRIPWFRPAENASSGTASRPPERTRETDRSRDAERSGSAAERRPQSPAWSAPERPRQDAPPPARVGGSESGSRDHGVSRPWGGAARNEGGERSGGSARPSNGGSQPRGGGEVHSSGGGQSRPAAPSGGSSQARPSGDGGGHAEHAAPRPHRRD